MTLLNWIHPDGRAGALDERRRVVHARGGLPGDTVALRVERETARAVDAVAEVLTPSPDRRAPPCPWDAACGGCDLAAWAPEARRAGLATMVQRALNLAQPPAVVPSPRATGHRARVKLAVQGGKVGYRGARSHTLVEVDTCGVARPEVAAAIDPLRALLAEHPELPAADVELRSDGARVVYAFHGAGGRPSAVEREALARLGDVAWDGRATHGDPVLHLQVAGLSLRASPDAFYQVNLEGNALLVEHVHRAISDARPERLLDLYAGIGNLGLPLAARGVPLLAVEHAGASLHDLSTTATALGLSHVRALPLDAARFDPSREPFDAVILDPPRAGAGEVLPRVLRNRPRRAVLVSCDVLAASRDHRAARDAGYTLQDVTLFDLFPDTHHVEVVSVWDRPSRAGPPPRR